DVTRHTLCPDDYYYILYAPAASSRFFSLDAPPTIQDSTLSLHDALPISQWKDRSRRLSSPILTMSAKKPAACRRSPLGSPPRGEIGRAHAELQSRSDLVCRLLLEKKKNHNHITSSSRTKHQYTLTTTSHN